MRVLKNSSDLSFRIRVGRGQAASGRRRRSSTWGPPGTSNGLNPGREVQAISAVAEGFEPSVGCPTLAFEASSFGRSDTPPRESLANPNRTRRINDEGRQELALDRTEEEDSSSAANRESAQSAPSNPVIPARAGIPGVIRRRRDPRLHGNDGGRTAPWVRAS